MPTTVESYPPTSASAAANADATEPTGQEDYAYGPPVTVPRETNFVSDENLLLWLTQKEEGLYGELRDHMDMSRERSKLIEDLNHVKDRIDNGASGEEVEREVRGLLAAYEDSPFHAELEEALGPTLHDMEFIQDLDLQLPFIDLAGAKAEEFSGIIKGKVDALGRDDQLELVEIQSLTADIREAAQLASNLLSSSNQAANAIVGNIAR